VTPRLELVKDWQGVYPAESHRWSHDDSRFYYPDPRDRTKIRVKILGVGVTVNDDPIVDPAPVVLGKLRVGPPVDPLNPDRCLVASMSAAGTTGGSGILAMDLVTSTSWPLATLAGTGLCWIRGPAFSPDGSSIAFGAVRPVTTTKPKRTTYFSGVYKIPFFGGPITRVTELNSGPYFTVDDWNTP
jgi:hypothetical protein